MDKNTLALQAGRRYSLKVEHTEQGGEATMKLFWSSPNTPQQIVPRAALPPDPAVPETGPTPG